MALSEGEYRELISATVAAEVSAANIGLFWQLEDDYAAVPKLRFLRTMIRALDMAIGNLDQRLTNPLNDDNLDRLKQRSSDLRFLRGQYAAELDDRAGNTATSSGPRTGALKRKVVIESPPGYADQNDPYWRGLPQHWWPGRQP